MTPETCPNCGADVPPGANACPECGADEQTGWSEEAYVGGLGLPDDEFDHDEFVQHEFGKKQARPHGVNWFWWVVAIAIAAIFILGVIGLRLMR